MSSIVGTADAAPDGFPHYPSLVERRLAPVELQRALSEQGEAGRAWVRLARTLLTSPTLPGRTRELVILRVAFLRRCEYVWGGHILMAHDEGLDFPLTPSVRDATVVDATDQLVGCGQLDDRVRHDLEQYLSVNQIVELAMVVSQYLSASMITQVRGFGRQDGGPALPVIWPGPPVGVADDQARTSDPEGSSLRRAAIVGLGPIGTSIAWALREAGWLVSGYDISTEAAAEAQRVGAVDVVAASVCELRPATLDLVVVAVPPHATVSTVRSMIRLGAPAVTDVASIKGPIFEELRDCPQYVGSHPLAGTERRGPGAARADMFRGAKWVLSPGPATKPSAEAIVRAAIDTVGARPIVVSPERHDRLVAVISHLPHLAAAGLVEVVAHHEDAAWLRELASTGWRDTTRVASGAPELWTDILCSNSAAVVAALDTYISELTRLRSVISAPDEVALDQSLRCAATTRDDITLNGESRPPPADRSRVTCCCQSLADRRRP
ncbi:MAG: prephenate dehydrogenase/arogenate dehydrogenase family protein [Acidimicrobiales bacterium]